MKFQNIRNSERNLVFSEKKYEGAYKWLRIRIESDFSVTTAEALKKLSNAFKILRGKKNLIIYSANIYQSRVRVE